MKLRSLFLCAALLAGCFSDKQAIEIWLGLATDMSDCYSDFADCVRLTDGNDDEIEACVLEYEGCYSDANDAAKEADEDDGCITAALECSEECGDDEVCADHCRDNLEECASWYQRDCEEDCEDEAMKCLTIAFDEHSTNLDALMVAGEDCMGEFYEACIPACYDQ